MSQAWFAQKHFIELKKTNMLGVFQKEPVVFVLDDQNRVWAATFVGQKVRPMMREQFGYRDPVVSTPVKRLTNEEGLITPAGKTYALSQGQKHPNFDWWLSQAVNRDMVTEAVAAHDMQQRDARVDRYAIPRIFAPMPETNTRQGKDTLSGSNKWAYLPTTTPQAPRPN